MTRWTATTDEDRKIAEFPNFTLMAGKPLILRLRDGTVLQGTFWSASSGNNAGEGGRWSYYAGFALEMDAGIIPINYLDVESAMAVNSN